MSIDLNSDFDKLLNSWDHQEKEFYIAYELFEKNKRLFEMGEIGESELIISNENRLRAADNFRAAFIRLSGESKEVALYNFNEWHPKAAYKFNSMPIKPDPAGCMGFLIIGLCYFSILFSFLILNYSA